MSQEQDIPVKPVDYLRSADNALKMSLAHSGTRYDSIEHENTTLIKIMPRAVIAGCRIAGSAACRAG